MSSPQPPPDLNIPPSTSTVSVSIIDTTMRLEHIPTGLFMQPIIKGREFFNAPAFSFLIQHPTLNRSLVFDLGVRKDHENLSPALHEHIKKGGYTLTVKKNVRDILEEGGFDATKLEAVVWSHWHWDHVGDPSTFEKHTALIVGPGFKEKILPGYPANPNSSFLEADYADRELKELSFDSNLKIADLNAIDYFGDGSFYFLDAPGHAIGHVAGLARVTSDPDSFIFMGGDSCHHGGQLRPSPYLPLPEHISPHPFTPLVSHPCPGSLFTSLLRDGDASKPFYEPTKEGPIHFDPALATKTIEKIQGVDARDNVLIAVAHDESLLSVVEFFPKTADRFLEKGWVKRLKWAFLKDFGEAVGFEAEGRAKD